MTPVQTIEAARSAGFSLEVRQRRLFVRGGRPCEDLAAALKEHREHILEILIAERAHGDSQSIVTPNVDSGCPTRACPNCWLRMWWQRSDGGWVCGVCHPDPQLLLAAWQAQR